MLFHWRNNTRFFKTEVQTHTKNLQTGRSSRAPLCENYNNNATVSRDTLPRSGEKSHNISKQGYLGKQSGKQEIHCIKKLA